MLLRIDKYHFLIKNIKTTDWVMKIHEQNPINWSKTLYLGRFYISSSRFPSRVQTVSILILRIENFNLELTEIGIDTTLIESIKQIQGSA
jgi:hypothetical protein